MFQLKIKYRLLVLLGLCLTIFSCKNTFDDEKIKIGFSQCLSDHPWRDAMNHSMQIQASLYPEVTLSIYEAHNDVNRQIGHIEKMIADNTDVIIISPIEPDRIVPYLEKAFELGIPVIVIDRKINSGKYSAYVGGDNLEVGRNVGNYIVSSKQNEINVIELRGGDVSTPVLERSKGFRQIINPLENVTLLASLGGADDGIPKMEFSRLLDSLKHKRIDFVYAFNDEMAFQAWQVAREKGWEKEIGFIGVDGLNGPENGIELVRTGILEASILYPTGGSEAIELAMDLLAGKEVAKNNILKTTVIDARNADIMKNQFEKINDQQEDIEKQTAALRSQEEKYYAQNTLLKVTMALLAIIISLTVYSIYSMLTISKKNRQLQLTNKKITIQKNQISRFAEKIKQTNEAKLSFFTGLSHEFKTPITLILSSVESITETAKLKNSTMMNEVELIYNNSNRLLRLINNLLDFRKVEEKKFNLKASKTNLFDFSRRIYLDFIHEAKRRNIQFKIHSNNKNLEVYIDRDLMDKVYFNILSNAFKFTPDNGKVIIDIVDNPQSNTIAIHIKDSGIGIPEKEVKHIFEAFFKGSNNRKNSSGIGLHLSKELVELHKGSIDVRSYHGTEFVITLHKGKAHLDEAEIIVEADLVDDSVVNFTFKDLEGESYLTSEPKSSEESASLLLIEDNNDLSMFLKQKFKVEYKVSLSDGSDAIEMAMEIIPDIIVCDIMLPEKSGFEICEILKNDLRTSHIPIIVLTALSDKDSYLKGLQSGADLYLTKPFSYSILVQSIKSLLYNREKLRYYYTNNIYKIEHVENFGNLEQQFLGRINNLITENLDNSNFSVEQLADTLNISRVQLYRKIKAILGLSISDYINDFRLDKAKGALESTDLSISEIAYGHGFSSPNYFSTSFKNKYGVSPNAHRKVHTL